MFALFKRKNPVKESAASLYLKAMTQSRLRWVYEECCVPDSFDGRFDALLLHLYLIIQCLNQTEEGRALSQELFDTAAADFDQSLREIGVGDTGMKRRMKNMLLAFNGRMHAYDAAFSTDNHGRTVENLHEALKRNLYGTLDEVAPAKVEAMAEYVLRAYAHVNAMGLDALMKGDISYPEYNSQKKNDEDDSQKQAV